jgi:hypothetical protein
MAIWNNLAGTLAGYFRLGKTGPRLKNLSGVLEVRNAGDTAGAGVSASTLLLSGSVSIGTSQVNRALVDNRRALSGATTFSGSLNFHAVQSDVTTAAIGFESLISTQATTFTLAELTHFKARQSTIGAGSVVTSQYGFYTDNTLIGAANNYGYYSNIPAAAGRWNFFAAASANNAFAGNTRFGGVTAPVATVDVTGTIAATGNISGDSLTLAGNASPTYAAGKLVYDTTNKSLTFYNDNANIALQVGQENWVRVVNNTGSTIANGAAVYINGASGGLPTIALARADVETTAQVLGIVTDSIANGAQGYVTVEGMVRSIDTSAFAAGAVLYLSSTVSGGFTTTAPTIRCRVGTVAVSNATTGMLYTNVGTASTTTSSGASPSLGLTNALLTGTSFV